jgi:hypothetical protein
VRNRTLGVKMDPHVPFFFCSYVLLSFFLLRHSPGRTGNPRSGCPGRDCYLLLPEYESVTLLICCQSPCFLFVSWIFRSEAFCDNASPELTHYGPVVTVRFTRFNTHKFYVLPTQCTCVYGSQNKQRLFPHKVNSLDFILRRSVSCAVRTESNWV